jgi:hypothetical protein
MEPPGTIPLVVVLNYSLSKEEGCLLEDIPTLISSFALGHDKQAFEIRRNQVNCL